MPPLIEQKYECTACSLSVNSLIQLQQHFTGRKHKAKIPADSGNNMSKATDTTSSSKSISTSHPFGHQNVLNKKQNQSKGHVLATAVPQYNSKNKVITKYPNKGKPCPSEISNSKFNSTLTASQNCILHSAYALQNQQEISYLYKDPRYSNENIITNTVAREIAIKQPTLNHSSKIQHTISCSQNNVQKSHNFSIEKILQTGNNSFNKNNNSNCMQEKSSDLNHLNTEYPINIIPPPFPKKSPSNLNSENDRKRKCKLTSNDNNPRPIISVRKDLMSPVNSNQIDKEYFNIQPVSNIRQSNIQPILQSVEKSILTPLISNQDDAIVYRSNSITLTKTNSTSPLDSKDNINNHITLQMMKKDEMSLKCYTCNKDVFDSVGNSKSLIYDHLIFGRASCKRCSKTVSCSGFTKIRNSNGSCCKSDQMVYTHNPVYYLIGELDNCEKNPCYYLAEYMMKIKVLWIYMPWCQAVVNVKRFVENPYKIPSFIFKGWDESNSPKQITSLNKHKGDNHTKREKLNDKEIRKVKSMNKENKYPRMKRSLTDRDDEHKESHVSPPAKKIKSTLRTFRIKQEYIDNCETQIKESSENCNTIGNDCTGSINDKTNVTKCMPYRVVEFQHKQNIASNCNRKNKRHSKLDTNPTGTFAPIIVDVCSIQDLEIIFESDTAKISNTMEKFKDDINNAYHASQYKENLNIDNDLELSCGSTIMTPDASPTTSPTTSPHASPVDSTKVATDNILSKNNISSNYTNFTSLTGKICVSKYMQDVARINSNSLVSEKTIEECPMCYQKLSLLKITVNTENMVLKCVCSCNLHIHILPNINGKILLPFNDYDYKKSERILKMRKRRVNKRLLRF